MTMPSSGDASRILMYDANKKSVGVAYALWFFLGIFGAHRFYAGKTGTAVVMLIATGMSFLLTAVFIGVVGFGLIVLWELVDAFLIPGWIRAHNNRLVAGLHTT